jgi:hypothetical protein
MLGNNDIGTYIKDHKFTINGKKNTDCVKQLSWSRIAQRAIKMRRDYLKSLLNDDIADLILTYVK